MYIDRGVPYGSRIAVWRGLIQLWCFPLNKWRPWSSPLSPGCETGAADGKKGCLHSSPSTSVSKLICKGGVIACPGPLWLHIQCKRGGTTSVSYSMKQLFVFTQYSLKLSERMKYLAFELLSYSNKNAIKFGSVHSIQRSIGDPVGCGYIDDTDHAVVQFVLILAIFRASHS